MKADIFEHSIWLDDKSPKYIVEKFTKILEQAGFTILNFQEHFFTPQGYTALWLLSESHLAIHTFPEEGKFYVQLSSCSKDIFNRYVRLVSEL
jgi:S-adenosylmethionine/arginine decarboxylase-like enzyme